MKRSAWTLEEIFEFRRQHARRLDELAYPPEIVRELSRAREKWLAKVPVKSPPSESGEAR